MATNNVGLFWWLFLYTSIILLLLLLLSIILVFHFKWGRPATRTVHIGMQSTKLARNSTKYGLGAVQDKKLLIGLQDNVFMSGNKFNFNQTWPLKVSAQLGWPLVSFQECKRKQVRKLVLCLTWTNLMICRATIFLGLVMSNQHIQDFAFGSAI